MFSKSALIKSLPVLFSLAYLPCISQISPNAYRNPIRQVLDGHPEYFKKILEFPDKYDVRIIYTEINRADDNIPNFKTYSYGADAGNYYYPDEAVFLPVALAALEKLNKLHIIGLGKETVMITGAGYPPQTAAETDSTTSTGLPSIAGYIRRMLTGGDEAAYDRLYEFLGQYPLNEMLIERGWKNTRIVHRLGNNSSFSQSDNLFTNPVSFYRDSQLLFHQGQVHSEFRSNFSISNTVRGKGHIENDSLVQEPYSFSGHNYISLRTLHDMLKQLFFPELFGASEKFALSDDDYQFLYKCLSQAPKDSGIEAYKNLPDTYRKYLMVGEERDGKMPENVYIFSQSGRGLGFLTDVAYVVDTKNKVEFFLAAVIQVNENEVFGDDVYEYDTIGIPFMANLGRLIYQHELKRKKDYPPDFYKLNFLWED